MLSRTLEKIKKDLRKEGFSQGVQVGMQKGITAEKQKIALAMLQKGIDKRTIMEVTKLTKTQLEQLEKK